MYKSTADAHARRTRTGSHSLTPDQRGRFDAMVAKAKPELMEICSLEEQEKILSRAVVEYQTRISELCKRATGRWSIVAQTERSQVGKLHSDALSRLHSIRALRKRAASMAFCEVFRVVAEFILPDELMRRVCSEANDVIMTARREAEGGDVHL